jgi:dTMP kinase
VPRAIFVVLEGPDGSGKSTQAGLLAGALRERGRSVEHLRDPGGTAAGDAIRALLLGGNPLDRLAETHLFLAARAQMIAERLLPALAAGRDVVCERFTLSTVVYQGAATDLARDRDAMDRLRAAVAHAAGDLVPDLEFLLDVAPAEGLRRKGGAGPLDRIEGRGEEYQARVRAGYLAEAARRNHVRVIPPGPPEATAALLRAAVEERLRGS